MVNIKKICIKKYHTLEIWADDKWNFYSFYDLDKESLIKEYGIIIEPIIDKIIEYMKSKRNMVVEMHSFNLDKKAYDDDELEYLEWTQWFDTENFNLISDKELLSKLE